MGDYQDCSSSVCTFTIHIMCLCVNDINNGTTIYTIEIDRLEL